MLVGILFVLSLALTIIGGLSWRRTGNPRIGMVSIAFILFLVKGLFLVGGLYFINWIDVPRDFAAPFDLMLLVDVLVLTFLYLALFRKGDR